MIGATCTKYRLDKWKDESNPENIIVTRFRDSRFRDDSIESVTFTLKEYLDNPKKQFKVA